MTAFYSENDPRAAAWLRELIAQGHIAPGTVDERSIEDIRPDELSGYAQVHCFAGIGGWSYALRLAGWPDDRPVWTGSCPCQPFSAAGKRAGFADERHLWPAWHWLISQCRPDVVFGEQVAGPDGLVWFDLVSADLERAQYAVGAANLCAAGVGSPHRRQRLWFVAHANGGGERGRSGQEAGTASSRQKEMEGADGQRVRVFPGGDSPEIRPVAHAQHAERERPTGSRAGSSEAQGGWASSESERCGAAGGDMGDAQHPGLQERRGERGIPHGAGPAAEGQAAERAGDAGGGAGTGGAGHADQSEQAGGVDDADRRRSAGPGLSVRSRGPQQAQAGVAGSSPLGGMDDPNTHGRGAGRDDDGEHVGVVAPAARVLGGFWASADWLPCTDGKARPVEPGTFPLAHGVPARVGRLRGYGNAINPWVAAAFIEAAGGVRG